MASGVLASHRSLVMAIAAVGAAALAWGLVGQGLTGDPAMYARIAQEIAERGDPSRLTLHGADYWAKPPLLFWCGALLLRLGDGAAWTASIPSRLFALGCVLATYAIGRRLFGRGVGALAAIALLSTAEFQRSVTTLRMESALTLGMLLSLLGYLRARRSAPWSFWGGIAFGALAKGPPALLYAPAVAVHAWRARRRPAGGWTWIAAAALLALPAAWYVHHGLRLG